MTTVISRTLGAVCAAFLPFFGLVAAASAQYVIQNAALSKESFNPSRGDNVTLTYDLSKTSKITVKVFDPDGGLVRGLVTGAERKPGKNEEAWDGRDDDGKPIPNEAYLFTIETDGGDVYDPTTFSGGFVDDITSARFDREAGTVVYKLPEASRVLIRLGVKNGPMLKTLVDWEPRIAGSITEYWDGRDEDKVMLLHDHKDFTALITHVSLPDATVIAYGNNDETYRDYKLGRGKGWPQKPERPRKPDPEVRLRPENLVPPAWARAPRVQLSFPKLESVGNGAPEVKDVVDVRVDTEASDRDLLLKEQFEIIFYVDNVFFAEAERGYLPFNWRWELNQLAGGDHILTVNISSFRGRVGVASRKVRVVK